MDWYEEEVAQVIQKRDGLPYLPQTVFYGSSSIRLWENLYKDFGQYLPVNVGFGGSTLEACVYFFNRIVMPIQSAQKLIVYAGDNDLGDGKAPDEIFGFFKQLEALVQQDFPSVPCYYISVKPSISRWHINENIRQLNDKIKDEISRQKNFFFVNIYDAMLNEKGQPNDSYYDEDGLHLSEKGYGVWKDILMAQVFADK